MFHSVQNVLGMKIITHTDHNQTQSFHIFRNRFEEKSVELSGIDIKMHLAFYTVKLGMHIYTLLSCHAQ